MSEMVTGYAILNLAVLALAIHAMRAREWSWTGLYVAFGYMMGGMAKHEIWLLMLFDPTYAATYKEQFRFFAWPPEPG